MTTAPKDRPIFPPQPSELCRFPAKPFQQHIFTCATWPTATEPPWWYTHPGRPDPRRGTADLHRLNLGQTPGFGFGSCLLPYILDWGDAVGIMTRKKAYVSVLKSYPYNRDRVFAHANVNHFVAKKDKYIEPFYDYLIGIQPFAGWRWIPEALRDWMKFALAAAKRGGAQQSLSGAASITAATNWCLTVRPEWERLTVEPFPYGPRNLYLYYAGEQPAAS